VLPSGTSGSDPDSGLEMSLGNDATILLQMNLVVFVLRVVLGVVFSVASAGKLLDLAGSRRAVEEFGLSRGMAAVGGTVLPLVELAIAAGLIVTPSARWAGLAALALLLVFVLAIARLMRRGEAPDCHCFGQIHSEPAGAPTLIRNGLLAATAAVVSIAGPGRSLAFLSGEDIAVTALAVAVVALAVALASLLRENRDLRKRPLGRRSAGSLGLPIGTVAPDLSLRDLVGNPLQLGSLIGDGTPAVLVHISPQCGPCRAMAPNLSRWRTTLSKQLRLVAISSGDLEQNVKFAEELELADLLIAESAAFGEAFRARATPSAVMIDETGRVGARAVSGQVAIESLIRVALSRKNTGLLHPQIVIGTTADITRQ
jgi:peroxiredoxin